MNKHRIFEIGCIVALVLFIFFMTEKNTYSLKTAGEVSDTVISQLDLEGLSKLKKNKIKEEYGIDYSQIDSCVCYASDAIMDVREIMIIKLKENVGSEDIMAVLEERVTQKQILFDGYAPEESALLKDYILTHRSGFIFYAVGDFAPQALSLFKSAL